MTDTSAALPVPVTRDEVATRVAQTMGYVAVTTGAFAAGAYLGRDLSYGWGWAFFALSFGALVGMGAAAKRSLGLAVVLLSGLARSFTWALFGFVLLLSLFSGSSE